MEIKSINTIINEIEEAINLDDYDKAYEIANENIDLNKEYSEGEYVFKNLLEELLFQIYIKKDIKKKYPLILDYSNLYFNYGKVLLKLKKYEDAKKSFKISEKYNPINVKPLFGLCELEKIDNNQEQYKNLTLKTFKYDYTCEDLAKSFRNLANYYFHISENKIGSYLTILSKEYDKTSKIAIKELNSLENKVDKTYQNTDINTIKEYLKSNNLPYEAAIEVITICKTLGFQLNDSKKVVPALHYFQIAYDLTKDENIKLTINDLNEKIERKLNE